MYAANNKFKIGEKCMVFPDIDPDFVEGSRYVYGIIRDVVGDIVTVEITKSSFSEFKRFDQLWFPRYKVWAYAEKNQPVVQLSLF